MKTNSYPLQHDANRSSSARAEVLTLLFTEHDMEVVFGIAQKIAVLHQGRLIADGAPAEVRSGRICALGGLRDRHRGGLRMMHDAIDRRTAVSSSHLTPRWRGMDSNFQYASAVNLVVAPLSPGCLARWSGSRRRRRKAEPCRLPRRDVYG